MVLETKGTLLEGDSSFIIGLPIESSTQKEKPKDVSNHPFKYGRTSDDDDDELFDI